MAKVELWFVRWQRNSLTKLSTVVEKMSPRRAVRATALTPAFSNSLDLIWWGDGGLPPLQAKGHCFGHWDSESSGTGMANAWLSLGWHRESSNTTSFLRTVFQIFPTSVSLVRSSFWFYVASWSVCGHLCQLILVGAWNCAKPDIFPHKRVCFRTGNLLEPCKRVLQLVWMMYGHV